MVIFTRRSCVISSTNTRDGRHFVGNANSVLSSDSLKAFRAPSKARVDFGRRIERRQEREMRLRLCNKASVSQAVVPRPTFKFMSIARRLSLLRKAVISGKKIRKSHSSRKFFPKSSPSTPIWRIGRRASLMSRRRSLDSVARSSGSSLPIRLAFCFRWSKRLFSDSSGTAPKSESAKEKRIR